MLETLFSHRRSDRLFARTLATRLDGRFNVAGSLIAHPDHSTNPPGDALAPRLALGATPLAQVPTERLNHLLAQAAIAFPVGLTRHTQLRPKMCSRTRGEAGY